jgi:hypothetical protein
VSRSHHHRPIGLPRNPGECGPDGVNSSHILTTLTSYKLREIERIHITGGSLLYSGARRSGRAPASLTARGGGLPVRVKMNSNGQSASLRLLCPHDGQRECSTPTRSSVGPRADQSSTVVRCYAEERYGNLSRVCRKRWGKPYGGTVFGGAP